MKIRPRLGNISIRYKILVTSMAVFIPFAALTGTLAYKVMQNALEAHIESELTNTSETVRSMVQVSVRNSVRSYLRSVAETNLQLVEEEYERFRRGEITEARAKAEAAKIIISQKIGRSGYLYIVRSDGVAEVHPDPKVQGENFAMMSFVIEQVRMKNGYIEYEWKNPDEKEARGKALSMAYFKPWDWIISASAYRSEFADLVNVEDFRANVKSLKFGKSGYSFIFDLEGNLVVHPIFEGRNAFDVGEGEMDFLRKMLDTREGRITYAWKNPDDDTSREKIVVYQYVPEMEWIVASSAYFDDLYAPLLLFRNNALWMSLLFVGAGLYLSYRVPSNASPHGSRAARPGRCRA